MAFALGRGDDMTVDCNEDATILAEENERLRTEAASARSACREAQTKYARERATSFGLLLLMGVFGFLMGAGTAAKLAGPDDVTAPCIDEVLVVDVVNETCSHPQHKIEIAPASSKRKVIATCTCNQPQLSE